MPPTIQPQEIIDHAKLFIRRTIHGDLQSERALPAERQALAAAPKPIAGELAQDYASWRRSVLWVAAVVLAISSILKLISWIKALDTDSIGVVKFLETAMFLTTPIGAVLVYLAASKWTDLRRSRRYARYAWAAMFLMPFGLAFVPWAKFASIDPDNPLQAQATLQLGLALGISLLVHLGAATVALCGGIIRSSVILKTLIPESPAPGWATVLFAPLDALIMLTLFALLVQISAKIIVILGVLCMAVAPLVYVMNADDMIRPHAPSEVASSLAGIRKKALLISGVGLMLLILFSADNEHIGPWQVFQFLINILGGFLALTVVGADFILAMVFTGHTQAKFFHGSDMAKILDTKFSALESVGLTRLSTNSVTSMVQIQNVQNP